MLEPKLAGCMINNRPRLFIYSIFLSLIILGCGAEGGSGSQSSDGESSYNENADGTITLTWDSVTDPSLAGYIIYYGSISNTVSGSYEHSEDIGRGSQVSTTSTTFTLTGLIKKRTYYIAVTTYDNYGRESDFSNEVMGTVR
jgi:hypothetical protein